MSTLVITHLDGSTDPFHFDDTLNAGYDPPTPVLTGFKIRATFTTNATTVTDLGGPGLEIRTETRSIGTGNSRQKTRFRLAGDGEDWSAGGADVDLELLDGDDNVIDSSEFTVLP